MRRPPLRAGARRGPVLAPALSLTAALAACGGGAARVGLESFANLPDAAFAPNPYTVYELKAGFEGRLLGAAVAIDGEGHRAPALPPRGSAPERRIACLGGSFVFGLGLEAADAFPTKLADALNGEGGTGPGSRPSPARDESRPYRVANLGVPGYTSHEVAGALSLRLLDLAPDALVVADLDADALALQTQDYRDDYGHFWKVWVAADDPARRGTLGGRVVARWPGWSAERERALARASTEAFERNLGFILGIAAARRIHAVICLPDPASRRDPNETRAVERLAAAAERVCRERGARAVSPADARVPENATPAAVAAAWARAAAAAVAALPW